MGIQSFARKDIRMITSLIILTNIVLLTQSVAASEVDCSGQPDGTFLPHPTDCCRYFQCDHHISLPFHCPAGLWFDASIDGCNWPGQVNCHTSSCLQANTTDYPTTLVTTTTTNALPTTTTPEPTTTQKPTTTAKPTTTQKPTTTHRPATTAK